MHISTQQKQTKKFFERYAPDWLKNARTDSKYSINIIRQRNQYVETICSAFLKKNGKTLDVGSGTGDLVIDLLKKRYDSYGIDFSSSMIKKSWVECKKYGFPKERFVLTSFFEYNPDIKFNLISANGFIEYISAKELNEFLKKSHRLLENNGLLVLGSRNRLFNIFSFNDYTKAEIESGNMEDLIRECIIFNSSGDFRDLLKSILKPKVSKNLKNHAYTGVKVKNRFQYTPFQLIHILRSNGFEIIDLNPIHIHVLTTGARSNLPIIHDYMSNYLQDKKEIRIQIIPQSSSFMIAARKK